MDYTIINQTTNWTSEGNITTPDPHTPKIQPLYALIIASCFYAIIIIVGIVGNISVIWMICRNSSMRKSAMNIYILNIAMADLTLNLSGIPDVVQFLLDGGWVLGETLCQLFRYLMIVCLYISILSLLAVTIERAAAILHPMKAQVFLTKRRIMIAVASIWVISSLTALPNAIFHRVSRMADNPSEFCVINLSRDHFLLYKYVEFGAYFAVPLVIQFTLYVLISAALRKSTAALNLSTNRTPQQTEQGSKKQRQRESTKTTASHSTRSYHSHHGATKDNNTVASRYHVIKMLTACVIVYFLSYAPTQIFFFYETFSEAKFLDTWIARCVLNAMGFINASANPIIYCVCSESYRSMFKKMYKCSQSSSDRERHLMESTVRSGVSFRTVTTNGRHEANCEHQPINQAEEEIVTCLEVGLENHPKQESVATLHICPTAPEEMT